MNQPPFQPPPGGFGPPPGGYGPPGGGYGPPGGFGGPPGGGWGPPPDPAYAPQPHGVPPGQTSTTAIIALVTGILSVTLCSCVPVTSVPAVVCGFMARAEMQKDPSVQGGGMAIAGIVLGFVSIGLWVVLFMLGILGQLMSRL